MKRLPFSLIEPAHPLWLVGFRPFFTLACLSGVSLPLIWVAILSGRLPPPSGRLSIFQWHGHEMFYGFGWAVLGGFLLTSTKNWVRVRGYHGHTLQLLALSWVLERLAIWMNGQVSEIAFRLSSNLFIVSIVVMLVATLVRHRKDDTFRDNYFFLLVLPLFLVAKNLMLSPGQFAIGTSMTTGLFRMAFLVMLERTLTQFMKNVFSVSILRNVLLDTTIKFLGLVLVVESMMPPLLANSVALALALLLCVRFAFWRPWLGLRRLDIGVMYLGYLAIMVQLVMLFLRQFAWTAWIGTVPLHVFTFGAMGLVIPAMLIRICNGHTGRKVVFGRADKLVLWIMIAGFMARIIAPQLYPAAYHSWLWAAAMCWFVCFTVLAYRYLPLLAQPRIDGKDH